jgi:hypothetical protein
MATSHRFADRAGRNAAVLIPPPNRIRGGIVVLEKEELRGIGADQMLSARRYR